MARPFSDKTDDEVMCRGALHAWVWIQKDAEDEQFRKGIPGTVIVWQCSRCDSLKYQKISPVTGHPVTSPTIKYSETYLLDQATKDEYGQGGLKDQARLELLRRFDK